MLIYFMELTKYCDFPERKPLLLSRNVISTHVEMMQVEMTPI